MCVREKPAAFRFIYYENHSKIGSTLWECLLNKGELQILEPPSDGDLKFTIRVKPYENAIVVFEDPSNK